VRLRVPSATGTTGVPSGAKMSSPWSHQPGTSVRSPPYVSPKIAWPPTGKVYGPARSGGVTVSGRWCGLRGWKWTRFEAGRPNPSSCDTGGVVRPAAGAVVDVASVVVGAGAGSVVGAAGAGISMRAEGTETSVPAGRA